MAFSTDDHQPATDRERDVIHAILRDEIAALNERIAAQAEDLRRLTVLHEESVAGAEAAIARRDRVAARVIMPLLRRARDARSSGAKAMRLAALVADSPLFDADAYAADLPAARWRRTPALHYVLEGSFEGRDPGPDFSTIDYYAANPDVAESGWPALAHYLTFGRDEQRSLAP